MPLLNNTAILTFSATVLGALTLSACGAKPDIAQDDTAKPAQQSFHERILTLDTHVDVPLTYMTPEMDPGTDTTAQVDLNKMVVGGLDAAFFIVYVPQTNIATVSDDAYADARQIAETRFAAIKKMTETYSDRIELALTAADVRRIHKAGKRAALIGMENAFPLGPSIADVPMWAKRGVRYVGLTHFGHNQFGDSSNPNKADGQTTDMHGGLSPLGKDLVAALNKAGIMVDVSHTGKTTMMQAVSLSKAPVIASHSGVKAVADSARNLDDEQLRALATNGGVVQIVAFDSYVKTHTAEQTAYIAQVRAEMGLETRAARSAMTKETRALYTKRVKGIYDIAPRASVANFADHIDHAVKIAGIDHVGISSDFDGGGGVVGWENAAQTESVTKELLARGYSEADIEKIWSGNLLRVMAAVEVIADK